MGWLHASDAYLCAPAHTHTHTHIHGDVYREFHQETVDKLKQLYMFDCLRANKATSAWGVEVGRPVWVWVWVWVCVSVRENVCRGVSVSSMPRGTDR